MNTRIVSSKKSKWIIIILLSICISLPLKISGEWQGGLNLSKQDMLFKLLNEFVQPFTQINIFVFFGTSVILWYVISSIRAFKLPVAAKIFTLLYAIVLGFFINYGRISRLDVVSIYVYYKFKLAIFCISSVGLAIFIYLMLNALEQSILISKKNVVNNHGELQISSNALKCFLTILICWIPYIVILYPAAMSPDTYNQLLEFFGHGDWTRDIYPIGWYLLGKHPFSISNQHDFLVTLLYGINFKIGLKIFHNAGIGLFISSLEQVLAVASSLTYSLVSFQHLGMTNKKVNYFKWFYALFPMLPIISMFLTKNVFNSAALLGTVLLLANLLHDRLLFKKTWWWLGLILTLFIQLATQKYAMYIIVFSAVISVVIWFKDKHIFRISLVSLMVVICFLSGQHLLFSMLQVPVGDPIEGEAVMIQSTALYQKRFGSSLTTSEKETINRVFVRKNLAKLYNPTDSDPIKSSGAKEIGLQSDGTFDHHIRKSFIMGYRFRTVTKNDIRDYKKVWVHLMIKHPEVLLEAFFSQGYSYIDPVSVQSKNISSDIPTDTLNIAPINFAILIDGHWIVANYSNHCPQARKLIAILYNIFSQMPPFAILLNGNLIIMLAILAFLITLAFRLYKNAMILFAVLLQVPIIMMSPINGSQRYMYPFFILIGAIIGLVTCWIDSPTRKK